MERIDIVQVKLRPEAPEEPWLRIKGATFAQEMVIRDWFDKEGYESLRGMWKWMEAKDWTYYDVLKEAYGR